MVLQNPSNTSSETDYRDRIYQHYVSAAQTALAPTSLAQFEPRAPYLKKLIREHFPKDLNAEILDLGCGSGAIVHFARQAGYVRVTGVDGSPEQVLEAARLGIKGIHQGDLFETLRSLSDASLDVIVAFDVIEHFSKQELVKLVDEVYRVLKKSGKWLIHIPNGESPFAGRIRYGDFTHELAFTEISIAQLLKASGFSEVGCWEDIPIPHGLKSFIRWLLWKLFRVSLQLYLAAETGERGTILTQTFLVSANK